MLLRSKILKNQLLDENDLLKTKCMLYQFSMYIVQMIIRKQIKDEYWFKRCFEIFCLDFIILNRY